AGRQRIARQFLQRDGSLDLPARRVAADGHEPARVPALVSPAIVGEAAALIDLKMKIRAVIPIEVDQQANAIEVAEVGVALADLHRCHVPVRRMLTAQGQVEKLLVVREACLGGTVLRSVAADVAQLQRLDALPADVIESTVEMGTFCGLAAP